MSLFCGLPQQERAARRHPVDAVLQPVWDAVVVGAGAAGLSCAAHLARSGCRTLLLERNTRVGGLIHTFTHEGFAFDAGIRAFENCGILFPMLRGLGLELPCAANPITLGAAGRWILQDDDGMARYLALLGAHFSRSADDLFPLMRAVEAAGERLRTVYSIDNPLFASPQALRSPAYLTGTLLPWLQRCRRAAAGIAGMEAPVYAYLEPLTGERAFADLLAQHFFGGTPAAYALGYSALYRDYCYPLGGTGALPRLLAENFCRRGGDLRLGTAVSRIDPMHRQLYTADGACVSYRSLVWAADQRALYTALADTDGAELQARRRAAAQGRGAESVLSFYFGTDLPPAYFAARCGAHGFYTPRWEGVSSLPHWKAAWAQGPRETENWLEAWLSRTTYELSVPCLRDASLAPPGQAGFIVSTLIDYSLIRRVAQAGGYESLKAHCIRCVGAVLERDFPGLAAHTLFALCATPLTLERETASTHGAIAGWAMDGEVFPAVRDFHAVRRAVYTPVPHLFQCGQWTFSPAGLPSALLTGKLAADAAARG